MTEMISFLGKARPRRRHGTSALIGESVRLGDQLTRISDRLHDYAIELRREVDRIVEERAGEEDYEEH